MPVLGPLLAALLGLACATESVPEPAAATAEPAPPNAQLAAPSPPEDPMSFDSLLRSRRSVRRYTDQPVTHQQLSSLLFAAQGITGQAAHERTLPSAGALHPLEIHLVVGAVEGLAPGVYHYDALSAELELVVEGDHRRALCMAALGQDSVCDAPLSLVIGAVYGRTTRKYGERGRRYVHMEVGHAAQNLYLQAGALGLGTVSVGAFHDDRVRGLLATEVVPLLVMPVGVPAGP